MKYTREYFLDKAAIYYDGLYDDLYDEDSMQEDRKEYYDMNCLYEEACRKMESFFSEDKNMSDLWFQNEEDTFDQNTYSKPEHYKLGALNAFECLQDLYRWDKDNPDYDVDFTDFMRRMKAKYLSTESDIKKRMEDTSEEYAKHLKEMLRTQDKFSKAVKEYPDAAEYYKNVFKEVQTRLFAIEDRDFYFAGCRAVLLAVMGVIFMQVSMGKEGE